ncbi:hypothetical protein DES53_102908 [Roseimicrobium gellanilyticum]|uniref:Type II secretion system protein GspG C-terminal domain-containing protein n=1 Tax=Roseimicrobium gellanilyticum TaxID=748857 RepID=A0A366HUY4_9BACT|nr:hypothetical protein [Roseimicrobium gellanilyticum]RBP46517.1 hypothetical protein DES53_102908 [Roseimicrobium gellanilyticum]
MSHQQSSTRFKGDGGIPSSVWVLSCTLLVVTAGLYWVSGARRTVPPAGAQAGTVMPSLSAKTPSNISIRAQAAADAGTARVVLPDNTGALVLPELAESARELNAPGSTVERDLEIVDVLLDAYRKMNHGTNPQGGENDEIVAQLTGAKGNRLAVFPPDHPFIDPQGRLLDRWGTPFHFHPVSSDTLEVRSAGPDQKLWTPDDVIQDEAAPSEEE